MMNKILVLGLLLSTTVWSQGPSEEAIILNQELQFLEEAANNVSIISANSPVTQESSRPANTKSLEERYFSDEAQDSIKTRTAAPKRRSY
jgi:hypothetical protein